VSRICADASGRFAAGGASVTTPDDVTTPDERPAPRRFSRRRLVVVALATGGAVLGVDYARYAAGDAFEDHVADLLGISVDSARELTRVARDRLGETDYRMRATAFLVATTAPGEWIIPDGQRQDAIEGLVTNMIGRAGDNFIALGLQPYVVGPCRGLLKS
jgi:hypothetical protein